MRSKYVGAGILVAMLSVPMLVGAAGNAVVDAVKAGNQQAVRALIQQKANVNTPEADGMTALHWAARANDTAMAQILLRAGANAKAANRYGITPLSLAAQNGNAPLVSALLTAGADPNAATPEGETVLMTAARTGNVDIIKSLVARGAKVDAKEQWQGQSALMWAASENNAAAVKTLVELGASPNDKSKELSFPEFKYQTSGMVITMLPRGGWTALMYAARDNAIDAATILADLKADVNAQDPDGTTALMVAIINAHFDLAAALIEKGADPNVADSTGTTALYNAVDMHTLGPMLSRPSPKLVDKMEPVGLVQLLLSKGANPNARLKRPAIGRHHTPVADASLGEGTTPLIRASKSNDIPVMDQLLKGGADPTLALKDRTTALMIAAAGGAQVGAYAGAIPVTEATSLAAIKLLSENGVDVNAFSATGQTALHLAAGRGADSVVKYLAERGAKLDMKDKQGRTPLDYALGQASGGRRGGGGGGGRGGGQVRESTAALLRQLMAGGTTTGAQPN